MTSDEIAALLTDKAEIDRRNTETLATGAYERWTADALAALLSSISLRQAATAAPASKPTG